MSILSHTGGSNGLFPACYPIKITFSPEKNSENSHQSFAGNFIPYCIDILAPSINNFWMFSSWRDPITWILMLWNFRDNLLVNNRTQETKETAKSHSRNIRKTGNKITLLAPSTMTCIVCTTEINRPHRNIQIQKLRLSIGLLSHWDIED